MHQSINLSLKTVSLSLAALLVGFSMGILVQQVLAWTEPGSAPPGGNVSAPLNVGLDAQSKAGGLILNTGGAATGLIVDQGDVGIGTDGPAGKLDVRGNIYMTGQGVTACPIWKDCDGDGFTLGYKDCDEGCATCYVGSTDPPCSPDGYDQNCNGLIDEAGGSCLAKTCGFISYPYKPFGYHVREPVIETACQNYCVSLDREYTSYDCDARQIEDETMIWMDFDFSSCRSSSEGLYSGETCYVQKELPLNVYCNCTGYR